MKSSPSTSHSVPSLLACQHSNSNLFSLGTRAQLRNLLACDSVLVVDEICARGQRFGHLDSSRKCYDSIMMGKERV